MTVRPPARTDRPLFRRIIANMKRTAVSIFVPGGIAYYEIRDSHAAHKASGRGPVFGILSLVGAAMLYWLLAWDYDVTMRLAAVLRDVTGIDIAPYVPPERPVSPD